MSTFNTSIHGVKTDSVRVDIKRFDGFIACDIIASTINYEGGVNGDIEFTLFFEEHHEGTNLHDALVNLRALFPTATFEDVR